MTGVRHIDRYKTEVGFLTSGTGTGNTLWIDMQWYSHVTFFILTSNSTGTPAATLQFAQALTTGGSSSKGISPVLYFVGSGGFGAQSSAADAWVSSALAASSFAAISTVSTLFGYAVEIQDTDLDLTNAFKCVQMLITATSSITTCGFVHAFPRFGANYATLPTALT
jgi:hypothetical protein